MCVGAGRKQARVEFLLGVLGDVDPAGVGGCQQATAKAGYVVEGASVFQRDQVVHCLKEERGVQRLQVEGAGCDESIEAIEVDLQRLIGTFPGKLERIAKAVARADNSIYVTQIGQSFTALVRAA